MLKWIIAIAFVITAVILGVLYVEIKKMEQDPDLIPISAQKKDRVPLVHAYVDGIHRYVGELKLPHSCFSVSTEVLRDPKDPLLAHIRVTTKDNMLEERICSRFTTGYAFETLIDAPEELTIVLFVDDKETRYIEQRSTWQSPKGTIIR